MGLNGTDLDPIDPDAWWRNDDGPVFQSSDATVGVGHASFYPTVPATTLLSTTAGALTTRRAGARVQRVRSASPSPKTIHPSFLCQSPPGLSSKLPLDTCTDPHLTVEYGVGW